MNHWVVRDPKGKRRYKIYEPSAALSLRLTIGASNMRRNPLAVTTVDKYVVGALPLFDYAFRQTHGAACAYSPWQEPASVRSLLAEFLESEGCTLEEDTKACTNTVTAPVEKYHFIAEVIAGVYHYYVAMSRAKVYPFGNPFEIPHDKRQPIRLESADGRAMTVTPTFWFRMAEGRRGPRRMDNPNLGVAILDALGAFRKFPVALLLMFTLMSQGLSRIAEECALTVLDWWRSKFGNEIATPNKGDGLNRTKFQVFEEDLAATMRTWFDTLRKCRKGSKYRTLKEWRDYLEDEEIPWTTRQQVASAEPLFTRPNGLAYQPGGARKWYRKAVRAAKRATGLPPLVARPHYLRHAGVNLFLAHLAANETLTQEQKEEKKRLFGEYMGWKWPMHTIGEYSAPQRDQAKLEVAREFLSAMDLNTRRIAEGHGSIIAVAPIPDTENDNELMNEFDSYRFAA